MPIVVAILGVVIVVMGAVLFLMPSEQAEAPVAVEVEPVNRTEEMEQTEESAVEVEATAQAGEEMSTVDTPVTTTQKGVATYLTPARTEHEITVELTLTGDIVTEANVLYDGLETVSNPNHERFDDVYKTEVIGKTLAQISLSRVGGASLTSQAFNEAVAKMIATQS